MGKVTGFLEVVRAKHPVRPVFERLHDWREVYAPYPAAATGVDLRANRMALVGEVPAGYGGSENGSNCLPDVANLYRRPGPFQS